jgi:hypothetical protein
LRRSNSNRDQKQQREHQFLHKTSLPRRDANQNFPFCNFSLFCKTQNPSQSCADSAASLFCTPRLKFFEFATTPAFLPSPWKLDGADSFISICTETYRK